MRNLIPFIAVLFIISAAQAQSGGQFEIRRSIVEGSGGRIAGGVFEIDATIGQGTAGGPMSGGIHSVSSGIWDAPGTTSGFACPLEKGYWKDNPNLWPVDSLVLGSEAYTKAELLDLLNRPVSGRTADASLILAHQLIAAKLNLANGSDPAPPGTAVTGADSQLAAHTGRLPYSVAPRSPAGQNMVTTASELERFNKGLLTPACSIGSAVL